MPIRTTTTLKLGKVRTKTTAWAPMLPTLRSWSSFSLVPPLLSGRKKRRRTKKKQ
jgi:hypothetical protein